ncbi:hypothetical protein M0638_22160 [Roseomonas sp. NAR14]|uniref:Quinol:cytochrome c oxidoreductase quinone-binding subunit 2 n=1 Tax=Roseomonas acroporae TaxID=2937791 RepID=A0A9X1YBI1_9PROT|nr:hypothetical protein [Roseomonas acroporae]MCK8787083.1 hypothetical protein [Roseomonas acroporae]
MSRPPATRPGAGPGAAARPDGAPPGAWLRARAGRALLLGLAAAAALGLWALVAPAGPPAAGWLVGLAFWASVALGAVALLAVHALTGGRWGESLRPALAPAALGLPALLPLLLPLLLGLTALYPWAVDPGTAPAPDVARLYLNPAGFRLRTLLAWGVWCLLGWLMLRLRGGARAVAGALGLVFHLGAVTLVALDWLLSIDPHFQSTAFGVAALVMQMMAALAWAALLRPAVGREAGDLAALLFAAVLGALYLGFVQYLVAWYGDLPDKARWFLRREGAGWLALQGASFLLAALLPLVALLRPGTRRSPAALAGLGAAILAGFWAHLCWIVAPAFGASVLPAALLGVLAVGGIWLGLAYGPAGGWLLRRAESAPGEGAEGASDGRVARAPDDRVERLSGGRAEGLADG